MQSDQFIFLAVAAQKFGCRPSALVALHDPVLALDFDLAAAARLVGAERAAGEAWTAGSEAAPVRTRNVRW